MQNNTDSPARPRGGDTGVCPVGDIDQEVQRLLKHLDSQEAAMLAIRSLLSDMASESLSVTDRRRLRTRLDAAQDLTRRLNLEREQILEDIACRVPGIPRPLRISQLVPRVSEPLRPALAAARRRLRQLAARLSRQSAMVRIIQGEERRINAVAYQMATGMVGSERYDATGLKTVQPAPVHVDVRS